MNFELHTEHRAFLKTTQIHVLVLRQGRKSVGSYPPEAFPPSCVVPPPNRLRSITKTGADYHN